MDIDSNNNSFEQPHFFRLPKELRLAIYEYALDSNDFTRLGTYAVNQRNLAEWPQQPGFVRACSTFRDEALPMYFAQNRFRVALQSQTGTAMTKDWLKSNASSCKWAFNDLRHVTVIVGAGVYERPEEFVLDLHLRKVVSSRIQLPQQSVMFGANIWGHPAYHYLHYQLGRMPDRRSEDFDIGACLQPLVQTLFREFTIGDDGGFML